MNAVRDFRAGSGFGGLDLCDRRAFRCVLVRVDDACGHRFVERAKTTRRINGRVRIARMAHQRNDDERERGGDHQRREKKENGHYQSSSASAARAGVAPVLVASRARLRTMTKIAPAPAMSASAGPNQSSQVAACSGGSYNTKSL